MSQDAARSIPLKRAIMKAYTMRKDLVVAVAVTGILAAVALSSRAEDNPAALAKALPEASVSLDQGLKASEREGKPISGKYEIEDGALQLSVYAMEGEQRLSRRERRGYTGRGKTGGQHRAHERRGCQEGHGEAGLRPRK